MNFKQEDQLELVKIILFNSKLAKPSNKAKISRIPSIIF